MANCNLRIVLVWLVVTWALLANYHTSDAAPTQRCKSDADCLKGGEDFFCDFALGNGYSHGVCVPCNQFCYKGSDKAGQLQCQDYCPIRWAKLFVHTTTLPPPATTATTTTTTVAPTPDPNTSLDLRVVMYVAIGLAAILASILVVVVICCCCKKKIVRKVKKAFHKGTKHSASAMEQDEDETELKFLGGENLPVNDQRSARGFPTDQTDSEQLPNSDQFTVESLDPISYKN